MSWRNWAGLRLMRRVAAPAVTCAITCVLAVAACVVTSAGVRAADRTWQGQFLIAAPKLADPIFGRSVILMLEHNDTGALGIIINRRTEVPIGKVFPLPHVAKDREDPLFVGGPVQRQRIFVLMRAEQSPPAATEVVPDLFVSTRQPALDHVLEESWSGDRFRVIAGYAGWSAGQLESEVKRGDWRFFPASAELVFDVPPEHLWDALNAQTRGFWAVAE